MSVADWIRKAASAESKRLSMKLYRGMMPEGESMLVDLAQLAAIQHEFVRYDICPRHNDRGRR